MNDEAMTGSGAGAGGNGNTGDRMPGDMEGPNGTQGYVPQGPPAAGHLLGGRYRLVEKLGQGGMGTVWKAHDEAIDREVAAKEPRLPTHVPDATRDMVFARLEREARAAAKIDHPSVVNIHDVVSVNGRPWVVMELIRGQSLAETLAEGTLSPPEAARTALAVLGALVSAHRQGVLHRDVKPANIMMGSFGRVVLTDFGIASVEGEEPLTETGSHIGSPEHMAPERVRGHKPGPASDLFSLGVVLYTALEGFSPFHRHTAPATLHAVLDAHPAAPTQAGELGPLIQQLLSKEPGSRPTPGEAEEVLKRVVDGTGPAPRILQTQDTTSTVRDNGRNPGRGRARAAGLAVAASAVTGAVVAALLWPASGGSSNDSRGPEADAGATKPANWETHKLSELGASLALPPGYEQVDRPGRKSAAKPSAEGEQSVWLRLNRQQADQQVIVLRNDEGPPPGGPADVGKYWYEHYTNPANNFTDQEVTVEERKPNGEACTALTVTYRHPGQSQLHRKRELYCSTRDNSWTVVVDAKVETETRPKADSLFNGIVNTFSGE